MDDTEKKKTSNSDKVTTPNVRQRSPRQTTPDSTSRELRKIEDYWTRKNPVIDDSPRLRSKRKVNFDVKETIFKTKTKPNLPESPFISATESIEHRYVADVHSVEHDVVTTLVPTEETEEVEEDHDTDTSDSDDDDYIPPRKKLRSEVTNDELWEGIPLTVSFKRLAPISKPCSESSEGLRAGQSIVGENEPESNDTAPDDKIQLESPVRSIVSKICERSGSSVSLQDNVFDVTSKDNEADRITADILISLATSKPIHNKEYAHLSNDLTEDKTESGGQLCVVRSPSMVKACNKTYSQILIPDCDPSAVEEEKTTKNQSTSEGSDTSTSDIAKTHYDNDKEKTASVVTEAVPESQHDSSEQSEQLASDPIITPMRRSRRLSEHEKRRSQQNTPNAKTAINFQNIPEEVESKCTSVCPSLADNAGQDDNEKVQSNPKLTFGPIKLNKHHRAIPPLRIRLKQPACSKKKTSKAMVKDDSIENAATSNTGKDTAKMDNTEKGKTEQSGNKKGAKTSGDGNKRKDKRDSLQKDTNKTKGADVRVDSNSDSEKPTSTKKENKKQNKVKTKSDNKHSGKKKQSLKTQTPDEKKKQKKKKVQKPKAAGSDKPSSSSASPDSSDKMTLRLNNVRRISAASELLSNSVLNKHACVLWSSENRRHVQLSNPNASITTIDTILIKKWEKLSEREKMRYFQRARDALKEENRHSNRRTDEKTGDDEKSASSAGHGIESFQALSPASQMTEIKKWLNLYHGISPAHCALVISSFKSCLNEENLERDAKLQEKSKQKSKSKKTKRQKKAEGQPEVMDSCSRYRKLLYSKILESKDTFVDLLVEQKKTYGQQILDNFSRIVKQLIAGEVVHFAGDITSDRLTETLYDLRALERENKVSVTGDNKTDDDFEDILKCIQNQDNFEDDLLSNLEDTNIDFENVEQLCKKIEEIPTLNPDTITRLLSDTPVSFSDDEDVNVLAPTNLQSDNSPVTLLTDLVADDILARQPKICFRRAVSLLSNKVVPSPTIIMAKSVDLDKTKNRNVVFTQIK